MIFISDHYRRLFPKAADDLTIGLSVDGVFERLALESGLLEGGSEYLGMKDFWERLSGESVFELGGGLTVHMRAVKLANHGGVMIAASDITEFRKQEKELANKTRELEAALAKERESAQVQQQFISMVSHEFRTPLSIIDGNAQLIMRHIDKADLDSMPKRAKTIRSAVSRLVQMMEGILSSSMIRSGKMVPKREEFDIQDLLVQLCDEQDELSPNNHITIFCENVPDKVFMDRKLVVLIMTNLLSNAVKYSGETPEVYVYASTRDNNLILRVADNGVGIPDTEKYKIFDRFYRATTSGSVPGTGIGLSLVREMVHLLKGRIEVHSVVGEGSEFTITLPL